MTRSMNALTDIAWIPTPDGLLSPADALRRASHIAWGATNMLGVHFSTYTRFLAEFAAVVLQQMPEDDRYSLEPFPEDAIAKAVDVIGSAACISDPHQPFMQQPALPPANAKDATRLIAPGNMNIKKLLPFMPPDNAEEFWSFDETNQVLPTHLAVRDLAVFHYFSPAGNNVYDNRKCQMGSPALRFPGKDNSATEILWLGDTLLETLYLALPTDWVDTPGLPAWADRQGTRYPNAVTHPLWRASWSSNAAVALWNDAFELTAVRIGGIPDEWYASEMGSDKALQKAWWDQRNTQDPCYLYIPDKKGELKAQRLDIGRNVTDLAVEWARNNKGKYLKDRSTRCMATPKRKQQVVFIRHLVGGTASSPVIRASEMLVQDASVWAPQDPALAANIALGADTISKLHFAVTLPFRELSVVDKNKIKAGEFVPKLPSLTQRYTMASSVFWRNITQIFEQIIRRGDADIPEDIWKQAKRVSMDSFMQATSSSRTNIDPRMEMVTNSVAGHVSWIINQLNQSEVTP